MYPLNEPVDGWAVPLTANCKCTFLLSSFKTSNKLIVSVVIDWKLFDDDWKEEFLKTIDSIHGINGEELYVKSKAYHLIGLPFYNSNHEGRFKEKFENILT